MKRYVNELNKFRMNQVGFMRDASKKFIYLGDFGKDFRVYKVSDGKMLHYSDGTMIEKDGDENFDACLEGDISDIREDGLYIIECGDDKSRIFSIYDKIYDPVCRTLTQYYIWQRCGDDRGWNGNCHHGEKLLDKHGKLHHFCGGHHQSGDLRKWTFGAASGVACLSEYLRLTPPLWNKGDIEYDIAHSVKYYLSLISDEGYLFDSAFVPYDYDREKCEGVGMNDYSAFWKPFMYFDTPAPTLGHWTVIRLLSSAALSLCEYDQKLAKEAKLGAQKIWNYMMREGEKLAPHDWTIYPPLGHFSFKEALFDYFFEGSAMSLCGCAIGAAYMYRTECKEEYRNKAAECLEMLCDLAVYDEDGALSYFRNSNDSDRSAEECCYFPLNIPLAFAECLEVFSDHADAEKWLSCAKAAVLRYENMASSNCYGKTTSKIVRQQNGQVFGDYCAPSGNDDLAKSAVFLIKMAGICEKDRCLSIAQRLIDWLVGANPYDSSTIEGVGFNQVRRADFGEFFPGTPQIPGGVTTELHPNVFATPFGSEYDMPIVGNVLSAFSLYSKKMTETAKTQKP